MTGEAHAHADLIKVIGRGVVKAHFGNTPQGLYAWCVRGIPYTHRAAFAKLAEQHDVPLPGDFLAPPERAA